MIVIRLRWSEIILAGQVGVMRNVYAMKNKLTAGAPGQPSDGWSADIEGAAGELAVAKWRGTYWNGTIGETDRPDVGPYEVRTNTSRRLDDMIVRAKDSEDKIYISVLSFLPDFHLIGWQHGKNCKLPEYLRDGSPGRPPCYFVPRSALHEMEELPEPFDLEARVQRLELVTDPPQEARP